MFLFLSSERSLSTVFDYSVDFMLWYKCLFVVGGGGGGGADSILRCHLTSVGNPIVVIRGTYDRPSYIHNRIPCTDILNQGRFLSSESSLLGLISATCTLLGGIKWTFILHFPLLVIQISDIGKSFTDISKSSYFLIMTLRQDIA